MTAWAHRQCGYFLAVENGPLSSGLMTPKCRHMVVMVDRVT